MRIFRNGRSNTSFPVSSPSSFGSIAVGSTPEARLAGQPHCLRDLAAVPPRHIPAAMKILILNQAFYPDVVSTAQHAADAARELAARGHDVTVIASRGAYDNPAVRFHPSEWWQGVRILRVRCTAFGKKSKWSRAADFGSFTATAATTAFTSGR